MNPALGALLACVGLDPMSASQRFTFGVTDLMAGIPLVPLLILAGPAAPATSDGPTPAEAVKLTAPKLGTDEIEFEAGEGGGLSLRAWGQRPGTWVAMLPDINEPDKTGRDSATLRLAVLARNGQRWTALARAEEVRTADDIPCSDPASPFRTCVQSIGQP